jgi:hypothetical protein
MLCIQDFMEEAPAFHGDGLNLNVDTPCMSASDWTLASTNKIATADPPITSKTAHGGTSNDTAHDKHAVPQTRLRSRNRKEAPPATTPARKRRRAPSTRQNDDQNCRPGSTRPVVYAVSRNESKKTRSTNSSVLNYSIDDLVNGCQMDPTSLPPAVSTSYLQIFSDTDVQHRYMHL